MRCLDVTEAIARRAIPGCFSVLLSTRWLCCQWYGVKQPGIEPGPPRTRTWGSTTELLPPITHWRISTWSFKDIMALPWTFRLLVASRRMTTLDVVSVFEVFSRKLQDAKASWRHSLLSLQNVIYNARRVAVLYIPKQYDFGPWKMAVVIPARMEGTRCEFWTCQSIIHNCVSGRQLERTICDRLVRLCVLINFVSDR